MRKNKTIMHRAIALCLAFAMLTTPSITEAQDNSGEIAGRRKHIDSAIRMIDEAEYEVVKALEKVQESSNAAGDPKPWRELASQMSRYTQIVDGSLQAIDRNMKILLEADPGAALPTVTIKAPFAEMLARVRDRKQQIDQVRSEIQQKLNNVNKELADIDKKLIGAVGAGAATTVMALGPSSPTDFVIDEGGAAAMVIAFYVGALTVGTILAAGLIIKKGYDVYKATSGAAEKLKALQDIQKGLLALKRLYEDLIKSLDPALDEVAQIEAELLKHQAEIKRLEQKLVELSAGWQRRSAVFSKIKEAVYKAPPAPPAGASPYAGPSMDYGDAISESNKAWEDLLANTIDGATYVLRVMTAKNGAGMKRWENMEPYRQKLKEVADEWNAARAAHDAQWPAIAQLIADENKDPNNWAWNWMVGMLRKNTPGIAAYWKHKKEGEGIYSKFRARSDEAGAVYQAADAKDKNAYDQCIKTIDTERAAREKDEGANLKAFYELHKKWGSFEFTRRYSDYGEFGKEVNVKGPLSQVGWSGESLGWAAWAGTFRFPAVLADMKQSSAAGPLKGAKDRFAAWQKRVQDTVSDMRNIFSWARSQANTAAGLASESDSMASKVEARVEAWQFLRSYADYMDMRETLKQLKSYKPVYDMLSEENAAQAESSLKETEKYAEDVSKAASAMAQAPSVLETASRVITNRDAAIDVRLNRDIGASGSLVQVLSQQYGINSKALDELKAMIAGFASQENLEAHAQSILATQAYGSMRNKVLTRNEIEDLRKNIRAQAAKINRARDDYAEAYAQMTAADKALEEKLTSLKAIIKPLLPAQLKFLSKSSVLDEVASEGNRGIYLPDPKDFPDPMEGVGDLLEKYTDLSDKYYALVTPMLERFKNEPWREIKSLEKLAKRVDEEGRDWLSLESNKFTEKWNEISSEAYRITSSRPDLPSDPKGPLNKAYFNVMTKLNVLHDQFYRKFIIHKIPAIVEELRSRIDEVTKFLEAPEKNGGMPAVISWRQKLESLIKPGSDTDKLKSEPQVAPLVSQINGIIVKLQELAQKEEDLTWLRTSCWAENPRLNGAALTSAMGQTVVLTKNDLKSGAIEITFRLSAIDKIDALLISEDGGRSWKGIPKSQNVTYSFVPQPNRLYQPMIKMKAGLVESESEIFPGVPSIQYKDIDATKLVVEAVQFLAESYEARNAARFLDIVSRDFLGNRVYLEEGVRFDFDMFSDIRLSIFINRIDQGKDTYTAATKWNKTQTPRKTGSQQRTSGNTTLVFAMEDGKMKLKNMRGNLIYATLSPEIAESSGLNSKVVEEITIARNDRVPSQPGAGETEESGGV
ncbi:MAG: hypothetical protein ABIA77_05325, partial [Candidatus Omnitrophota bacterium]